MRLVPLCFLLFLAGACARSYRVRVGRPPLELAGKDRLALAHCKGQPADAAQARLLFPTAVADRPGWKESNLELAGPDSLLLDLYLGQWRLLRRRRTLYREHWSADAGPSRLVREKVLARQASAELLLVAKDHRGLVMAGPVIVTCRAFGVEPRQERGGDCRWFDPVDQREVPVHAVVDAELLNQAMVATIGNCLDLLAGEDLPLWLAFDNDDPDQAAWLAMAERGEVNAARVELAAYLKDRPRNAVAAFNLGVICESVGDLERALFWYDTALGRRDDARYRAARERCRRKYELFLVGAGDVL